MSLDPGSSDASILDTLELELRKLPSVIAAAFTGTIEDLTVHLTVARGGDIELVRETAGELVRRYVDRPVTFSVRVAGEVEVPPAKRTAARRRPTARPESPAVEAQAGADLAREQEEVSLPLLARVELLEVRLTSAGREVQVRLGYQGRHAVGRAVADGAAAAAEAALEALAGLGWSVPFTVRSAIRLAVGIPGVVAVSLSGANGDRFGLSRASTVEEAAVKATLQALNRFLVDPRHGPLRRRGTAGSA